MKYYTLGNPQEVGIAHRILGAVFHESQLDVISNVEGVDKVWLPVGSLTMVDIWLLPLYDADEVWLSIVAALDEHIPVMLAERVLENMEAE